MSELNDLYKEYLRKQEAINRSEPAIDTDNLLESLEQVGAMQEQRHNELTAWFRAARQAITGKTWEQEMADFDANIAPGEEE